MKVLWVNHLQIVMNEDNASELESENRILRPSDERELNRIKPNPTIRMQPVFMDPGPTRNLAREKQNSTLPKGLCFEITGRVQHDRSELQCLAVDGRQETSSSGSIWHDPTVSSNADVTDDNECSLDYS